MNRKKNRLVTFLAGVVVLIGWLILPLLIILGLVFGLKLIGVVRGDGLLTGDFDYGEVF